MHFVSTFQEAVDGKKLVTKEDNIQRYTIHPITSPTGVTNNTWDTKPLYRIVINIRNEFNIILVITCWVVFDVVQVACCEDNEYRYKFNIFCMCIYIYILGL